MGNGPVDALGLALGVVACALAALRWLRVAQREHYLAGAAVRFARRWWSAGLANPAVAAAGTAGAIVSVWYPFAGFAAVLAAGAGPIGLGLRGRTSRLAWTGRLRRLACLLGLLVAVAVGASAAATAAVATTAGLHGGFSAAVFCAMAMPLLADAALWAARPAESRLLEPYLEQARRRLVAVAPRIVAITGSYGKTTTKGYVAHLLAGSFSVVATPASFNNAAGLARSVNEQLSSGTQVFVAEMGTYGPGEIRAMCAWAAPEVSVITAIGPVHLERMGSLGRIAEAKAEILEGARAVVLNVEYPLLAELAAKAGTEGKLVWRCSSGSVPADVEAVPEGGKLRVRAPRCTAEMDLLVAVAPEVDPGNVACAVATALSLGVPVPTVAARLADLPGAPHRRSPQTGANGAGIVDDTYNANPAGAAAALALLGGLGASGGRRVVVTPGMVELGAAQALENANFAARAGAVATEMVVVGRTNAAPLLAGARAAGLATRQVRDRPAAVRWVSANLGPGDAVLYENDLPDHYP
ncbi:MAG: Mur ligase family protein [Acidimicrobiales bacterium]